MATIKKVFLTLIAFLFLIGPCFGAGASTTATATAVYWGKTPSSAEIAAGRQPDGVKITISATADDSTAYFTPILFDTSTNIATYKTMLGKWLTYAKTSIPAAITAPTANYDIYLIEGVTSTSDFVLNSPTLAIGGTTTAVSTVAFNYVINNVQYYAAAVAAGTAPGNDVIPTGTYGAVALDIGANGTIDAIEAADNATGYASAKLAIAGVAAAASDHVRLGYVTATKSDGNFTFGNTALGAANTTVAYTSTVPAFDVMGGRLLNRSATAAEKVLPGNSDGDNIYVFINGPVMLVIVNNSVASSVISIDLNFN